MVEQHGYAALLVTNLVNVRYLTGYTGTNGGVIVRPQEAVFLTDFRYLERVKPLREFIEVREVKREILQPAAETLADLIGSRAAPGSRAPTSATPTSPSWRRRWTRTD